MFPCKRFRETEYWVSSVVQQPENKLRKVARLSQPAPPRLLGTLEGALFVRPPFQPVLSLLFEVNQYQEHGSNFFGS